MAAAAAEACDDAAHAVAPGAAEAPAESCGGDVSAEPSVEGPLLLDDVLPDGLLQRVFFHCSAHDLLVRQAQVHAQRAVDLALLSQAAAAVSRRWRALLAPEQRAWWRALLRARCQAGEAAACARTAFFHATLQVRATVPAAASCR